jgi:hypothetical protein
LTNVVVCPELLVSVLSEIRINTSPQAVTVLYSGQVLTMRPQAVTMMWYERRFTIPSTDRCPEIFQMRKRGLGNKIVSGVRRSTILENPTDGHYERFQTSANEYIILPGAMAWHSTRG